MYIPLASLQLMSDTSTHYIRWLSVKQANPQFVHVAVGWKEDIYFRGNCGQVQSKCRFDDCVVIADVFQGSVIITSLRHLPLCKGTSQQAHHSKTR